MTESWVLSNSQGLPATLNTGLTPSVTSNNRPLTLPDEAPSAHFVAGTRGLIRPRRSARAQGQNRAEARLIRLTKTKKKTISQGNDNCDGK